MSAVDNLIPTSDFGEELMQYHKLIASIAQLIECLVSVCLKAGQRLGKFLGGRGA